MQSTPNVKKYTKENVTVNWQADKCIHSAICAKGLLDVFNPKARPWINVDGAPLDTIKTQIDKCPSGALSYTEAGVENAVMQEATKIDVTQDGPLLVHGKCAIAMPDGSTKEFDRVTALCRCGSSANKPFCDGAHKQVGFSG